MYEEEPIVIKFSLLICELIILNEEGVKWILSHGIANLNN